jgi:hypothetical protein
MGSSKHSKSSKSSSRDGEDSKKSKKRRRKDARSLPSGRDLLIAASLGDDHRCKDLLKQGADIDWSDGDLTTSLHAASRIGHFKTVQVLLRYKANASLQDLKGDTAAHLAARNLHLDVLSVLLRSKTIGSSLKEPNDKGETVEELAAKAMKQQEIQAELAAEAKKWQRQRGHNSDDDEENEINWEERLRRELSPGEEEAYYYYDHSQWQADQFETAEEYAKRIWIEMEGRRKDKERAASFTAAKQAAHAAAKKKSKLEDESKQNKDNYYKQEQKQQQEKKEKEDAAWRAAKSAGAASLKRASYEARWEFFCTKNKDKIATFDDIPWILTPFPSSSTTNTFLSELEQVLLHNAADNGGDSKRQILRRELIRWHPDKFISKFGAILDPGDREKILEAVTETSQQLTLLLTQTAVAR